MTNKLISLSLACLLSLSLHAEDSKNHPCQKIKSACEAAGFIKGDHKKDKKGLYIDCIKPILAGQTVAGVTVSAEDVSACKVKNSERKEKKQDKK